METAIDGLQGTAGQLADNDRVLATAKHFAGDGLTTYGTGSNSQTTGDYPIDQGVDQVDRADVRPARARAVRRRRCSSTTSAR